MAAVDVRAEINISEFLGTLKKLSSEKSSERKVWSTIILCCHASSCGRTFECFLQ